jgi:Tfp pilus assembly protein PilN
VNAVAVDFLPPDYRDRRLRRRAWVTYGTVAVVLLLAMVFAWYGVDRRRGALSVELEAARSAHDRSKNRIAQVEQLDLKKDELSQRLSVLRDVLARTRGALVLNAVAASAPESTLITRIDLRVSEAGDVPRIEITIEGRCSDHLDVANLLRALDAQPLLSDVRMVLSEEIDAFTAGKKFVVTARSPALLSEPPEAGAGAGA